MKLLILITMMACVAAQADIRVISPMPSANTTRYGYGYGYGSIGFDYDLSHYNKNIWYTGKRDFDRDPIPQFIYCGTTRMRESQASLVVYPKNLWDRRKFWLW